jgi:hypothetical protein
MNELLDSLQSAGAFLGFASDWNAWAYIGSCLACLLCIAYGLISWNKGRTIVRTRRSRRIQRMKKRKRPRQMRRL